MLHVTRTDRAHGSAKIVPSSRVRVVAPAPEPAPALSDHAHEPQITLVKDGTTVKAIIVQCSCGQTTRLECEY